MRSPIPTRAAAVTWPVWRQPCARPRPNRPAFRTPICPAFWTWTPLPPPSAVWTSPKPPSVRSCPASTPERMKLPSAKPCDPRSPPPLPLSDPPKPLWSKRTPPPAPSLRPAPSTKPPPLSPSPTALFFSLHYSLLIYGGPDGELGASLRYLSQRFSMPYPELKGLLTDIGISVSKLHIWISQLKLCHFDLEKVQLTRRFIPQSYTKRHIIEVNINHTIIINYGFV